jgi:uncharacterized NAD(P)/FAD-binding protein YdhS
MVAVQLLRRVPALSLAVVDKGPAPGRGLAFGTRYDCHLLNVPAGNMSALPEEPDHFLRWAQANYGHPVHETSFLPRPFFGRYISSLLEEATERGSRGNLQWIQGEVSSVAREQSRLEIPLTDGSTLATQSLVLAVGNFPPADLKIPGLSRESHRYIRSPWSASALDDFPGNANVLLIGSGLTSVDVAVALKYEGFGGHIHILSRRGLMPQTHRLTAGRPQFWNEPSPRTIRGLMRLVREEVRTAEKGGDWRDVVDSLRPVTQNIWQSLSQKERRRFLRHVRSYWEVHRHRIAPEIGDTISQLVQAGTATVYAGRVTNYREVGEHVEVGWRDRRTQSQRLFRVHRVINCTGPETDCRHINDPLIKSLLAQGLATPDLLSLGLDADSSGALLDSRGAPSRSLYAIGSARKGSLWESIAVPELRVQASQLAEHLVRDLLPHRREITGVTAETADLDLATTAVVEGRD